ncbi:hypothetical protein WJX73_005419 [Symbiochloris irregularis]|uniref:Uncharacterized protein n=1 Tax=Symbiochloris irregularis TaxID=706552 RepID=A0AAW1NWI0_9CHLO
MARYQLCAEKTSSQLGCSFHTYVSTQCREEKDAEGHPVRHCTRHSKRYQDCGRGRELVEESTEVITDPHIDRTLRASNLQEPFSAGEIPPRPQQALDSRLGEALEEVMLSAQDYRHLVSRPDDEAKQGRERPGSKLPLTDLTQPSKSYFSLPSLFWSATAGAKSREVSPGRKQRHDTWDEYAKDFQEV